VAWGGPQLVWSGLHRDQRETVSEEGRKAEMPRGVIKQLRAVPISGEPSL